MIAGISHLQLSIFLEKIKRFYDKKGLSFLFNFDIICKGEVSYVKEEEGKIT